MCFAFTITYEIGIIKVGRSKWRLKGIKPTRYQL